MVEKCLNAEIPAVLDAVRGMNSNYNPKILYTFVDRNISHRLFEKDNGNGYINPGPGTVLDTALVEKQDKDTFDFFLIPHSATVATA
jgi:hypothetical protein